MGPTSSRRRLASTSPGPSPTAQRPRLENPAEPPPAREEHGDNMTQINGTNGTSQNLQLQGKVYAVTGGASGIGFATAKILGKRGATVCIADIDPTAIGEAESYFTSHGIPHMVTKVDVSKRAQVDSWVQSIVTAHGRLDGAANAAGVIGKGHGITPVAELDDGEWDKIIGVNLTGTMYCLRAELRHVVNGGSIVNVSSIHGLKGFARHAAYDASKHGMIGLTKAAALENGAREIRVNSVAPGAIYTPLMQKNWDFVGRPTDAPFDEPTAFQRQGTAEETGNVIAFLLGPDSTFVSGSVYQVDGAWM
ncbi:fumarylacetoacetate hydrolase [Purpureocillium lavendulum]|uniref:Fumarylacetoacetate hydrolase n=1 Tax=Purpureocillium lavendulum TaxID=1247861 RepID=A0AB34FLT7_9HYPO|nr:fumarylacetoacetate hydrolase [Purpureocillium lavendulum]